MHLPLLYKEHLMKLLLVSHNLLVGWIYPRIHINYQLIGESLVAEVKEMFEFLLKVHEDDVHDLGLHLGRQLLVELELLDDHVEIIEQGILDVAPYLLVEGWRDVEGLV